MVLAPMASGLKPADRGNGIEGRLMNKMFLALALISLVLAPFDFALEGLYEGLLPLAWGALFLFLAYKDRVAAARSAGTVSTIQWILALSVIGAGILKLLSRVNILG
jgi:hypothetical protein